MFKNNWAYWTYDDQIYKAKQRPKSKFNFFAELSHTSLDHQESLINNAIEVYDTHKKIDILFSGGISSQIILYTYYKLKIPVNIKIFNYEKDLNKYYDVLSAIKFCKDLNLKYELIDFKLQKFFEDDAHDIWTKCYNVDVCNLPLLKMIEYCDNTAILGTGYPYITRNDLYYDSPAKWNLKIFESDINLCSYQSNKTFVANWFLYSKDLICSLLSSKHIQDLCADKHLDVLSNYEIRNTMYDIPVSNRLRQRGFEYKDNSFLYPNYMIEFFNQNIKGSVTSSVVDFDIY